MTHSVTGTGWELETGLSVPNGLSATGSRTRPAAPGQVGAARYLGRHSPGMLRPFRFMAARPRLSARRFNANAAITPLIAGLLGLGVGLVSWGTALSPARALAVSDSPGGKGAQVYCFMRANGNNHEVSWSAAYALIKRQSASLFRTSPEHAAVMITEAVVQNPTTFPDCGRYLGDLYRHRGQGTATAPVAPAPTASGGGNAGTGTQTRSDRFGN